MKKPELVIMCGSSRCGKSSWIEANLKDTHIVCSFDRFKKALTNAWWTQSIHTDFKQNSWNMTYSFFEEITNQQLDVVLDSNNSFANRRALWIDSARRKGYSIRGVEIFTPLEKCIERSKEEFPIDFPDNHPYILKQIKGISNSYSRKQHLKMEEGFDKVEIIDGLTGLPYDFRKSEEKKNFKYNKETR